MYEALDQVPAGGTLNSIEEWADQLLDGTVLAPAGIANALVVDFLMVDPRSSPPSGPVLE